MTSSRDTICRETETEGGQYSAFCAVNFQQLQLTNSMAKETGQPRAVQSIQWLWVSFIFHATYSQEDCTAPEEVEFMRRHRQTIAEAHIRELIC